MDGAGASSRHTVEEVFLDFRGRRAGLIKALTTDYQEFYRLCDPRNENMYLYGYRDERWEVTVPPKDIPTDLPEPHLGINFAREDVDEEKWVSLVVMHSDAWLLAVAFYFGLNFGFDKADRKRLFDRINDLPTISEIVLGVETRQSKHISSVSNNRSNISKFSSKRVSKWRKKSLDAEPLEEEGGEGVEDKQGETPCGACESSEVDEFWIFCDICERWFHGMCVHITPAKAELIDQYKCPYCSNRSQS